MKKLLILLLICVSCVIEYPTKQAQNACEYILRERIEVCINENGGSYLRSQTCNTVALAQFETCMAAAIPTCKVEVEVQ